MLAKVFSQSEEEICNGPDILGMNAYTYFQWTEDRQGFQIQYLTLDT